MATPVVKRVTLVSGGAGGMGPACARRFAAAGDRDVATDVSQATLVHTAGLSGTMAGWRRVMEVNLVGGAHILDAALGQIPGRIQSEA